MDKTVVKALNLLEALAATPASRGVSELAREFRLTRSNVHRLLGTLTEQGYARRDGEGRYALTLKLWRLGQAMRAELNLIDVVRPFLQRLRDQTGETARLSVFTDDRVVVIDQVDSLHPVAIQARVGALLPATAAATGKALLAFQPDETIERIARGAQRYTRRSMVSAELRAELAAIRRRSIAVNRGEFHDSVRAIGAPIRDATGAVVAAIGVSGPVDRLTDRALRQFAPMVKAAAEAASEALGYRVMEFKPARITADRAESHRP